MEIKNCSQVFTENAMHCVTYRFSKLTLEIFVFLLIISRIRYCLAGNIWIRQSGIFPLCSSCVCNKKKQFMTRCSQEIPSNLTQYSLWSMKKIRPSACTRSSQPSGNEPKSSSGGRVWLGIGLARPVRGSTHDVLRSLWSMKNIRPFGAICIVQPFGSPASKLFVCELSVVDASSLELCRDCDVWRATLSLPPLSAWSVSSFCYVTEIQFQLISRWESLHSSQHTILGTTTSV